MTAHEPATTDENGRFSLKIAYHGQPVAVLRLDKERKSGALVTVDKMGANKDAMVTLEPLGRVEGGFICTELNFKPKWTAISLWTADGVRFFNDAVKDSAFSLFLPPGKYKLLGYSNDIKNVTREFSIATDKPIVDLKIIDTPATEIAKFKGKAPPKWHITDARGVSKNVSLADFKGKWVIVDFFTHWCGPCVAQSLPALMDFYDEHKEHRDKFEVLAVHVKFAEDFADYDEKMKGVKKAIWHGKDLPFPLLLDATDETIKAFGISFFPTTILIDPDGNLVGMGDETDLEKRLPPISVALRVARALEKEVVVGFQDPVLKQALQQLASRTRLEIRLDEKALQAASVSPDDKVPLKMAGAVSLRSLLNLLLDAPGLTFGEDDKGLVIMTRKPNDKTNLSEHQKAAAMRINERLRANTTFDFKDMALAEVAEYFQEPKTMEDFFLNPPFLLDPAARKAGRLDPQTKVTGAANDLPLCEALAQLLEPHGLTFEVRNEAIVILPRS